MDKLTISFIVCTYNRNIELELLLESFSRIESNHNLIYELIVVDNNIKNEAAKIVNKYNTKLNVTCVHEYKLGLQNARNRGILESNSNWIFFLDDDIILPNIFFESVINTIKTTRCDVIGYKLNPIYEEQKPPWLDDKAMTNVYDGVGEIIGACMGFTSEVIEKVGPFKKILSLQGSKLAYGDDTYFIKTALNLGFKSHFVYNIDIKHKIPRSKTKLSNIIYRNILIGRSNEMMSQLDGKEYAPLEIILDFMTSSLGPIAKSFIKFISTKDYYFQNFLIDSTRRPLYHLGRLFTGNIDLS